jgi:hypothetical protein
VHTDQVLLTLSTLKYPLLRFQYLIAPSSDGQSGISPRGELIGEINPFYLIVRLNERASLSLKATVGVLLHVS